MTTAAPAPAARADASGRLAELAGRRLQDVEHVDDADDVVEPRSIDRHARVLLVGDLERGLADRDVLGQRGDLRQRHHQLADLVLGQLEHVRDHLALVGADLRLVGLRLGLDQHLELVARDERAVALRLGHARQQRRVAADDGDDRTQHERCEAQRAREHVDHAIGVGLHDRFGHQVTDDEQRRHDEQRPPRRAIAHAEVHRDDDHRDERREVRTDERGRERHARHREQLLDPDRRSAPGSRAGPQRTAIARTECDFGARKERLCEHARDQHDDERR